MSRLNGLPSPRTVRTESSCSCSRAINYSKRRLCAVESLTQLRMHSECAGEQRWFNTKIDTYARQGPLPGINPLADQVEFMNNILSKGIIHPNEKGHQVYADAIFTKMLDHTYPSPMIRMDPERAKICVSEKIRFQVHESQVGLYEGAVSIDGQPFAQLGENAKEYTFHLKKMPTKPPTLKLPDIKIAFRDNPRQQREQVFNLSIDAPPLYIRYEADKPLVPDPRTGIGRQTEQQEPIRLVVQAAEDPMFMRRVTAEVYLGATLKGEANKPLMTTREEIFRERIQKITPQPPTTPTKKKCPRGLPEYKEDVIDCEPTDDMDTEPVFVEPTGAPFAMWSLVPQDCFQERELAGIPPVTTQTAIPTPVPGESMGQLEVDFDRYGKDYKDFDSPQPQQCQAECAKDPQCRAFTFSQPGAVFPGGHCWLKNTIPPATPRTGFISGAKSATPPVPGEVPAFEIDFDRFGMDYQDFDSPQPQHCQAQCAGDPQCKAFTFSQSGAVFPEAHCWLKHSVPPKTPRTGFVSGTKPVP